MKTPLKNNEPSPFYFQVLRRLIAEGKKDARKKVREDSEYLNLIKSKDYLSWRDERYPKWRERNKSWVAPSSDRRKKNILVLEGSKTIKTEFPTFLKEAVRKTYTGDLWIGHGTNAGINKEVKNVTWRGLLSSYSKYEDNKKIFDYFGLSPSLYHKNQKYNFDVKEIVENGVVLKLSDIGKSETEKSNRKNIFNRHYRAAYKEYSKEYDDEKATKMAMDEAIFLSQYPELDNPPFSKIVKEIEHEIERHIL